MKVIKIQVDRVGNRWGIWMPSFHVGDYKKHPGIVRKKKKIKLRDGQSYFTILVQRATPYDIISSLEHPRSFFPFVMVPHYFNERARIIWVGHAVCVRCPHLSAKILAHKIEPSDAIALFFHPDLKNNLLTIKYLWWAH